MTLEQAIADGAEWDSQNMGNPVVHFELIGPDPARLREFYSRLFGCVRGNLAHDAHCSPLITRHRWSVNSSTCIALRPALNVADAP